MLIQKALRLLRGSKTGLSKLGANDKLCVAMSGGVDSSTVAALTSKLLGPERVKGVFMNNWRSGAKCSEADWSAVQNICRHIGINCRRIDLEKDYWTDVFEPMISNYRSGITPNPDVSCNRNIKFGRLIERLQESEPEFRFLATGHYAGIVNNKIVRPDYLAKDQSYYLSTVSRANLSNVVFPLAHLTKPEVRELAQTLVPHEIATKPDSQGLCFVEQDTNSFSKFLGAYIDNSPGPIETIDGVRVGEHQGLWTHTIGQRASIAMPQHDPATKGQWFVVKKEVERNCIVIAPGRDHPKLWDDTIFCHNFSWHEMPPTASHLWAQYRSLQTPIRIVNWQPGAAKSLTVTLESPRRAIAAGQYLVIYDGEKVIGAGVITRTSSVESASLLDQISE